jgi:hypothetical protein
MPKRSITSKAVKSAKPNKLESMPSVRQFTLFSKFLGDTDDLSNTIELWDAIPKYAFTLRRQNKVRDENNRLGIHSHSFTYANRSCHIKIQPATIELEDGAIKDFYPSADEELVEEVLRKVFADQQFGRHDAAGTESWVKFSLQMIRKELQKRGKTRSLDEIKRSIEILSKAHISFFIDDDRDPIYMNAVLTDVTRVTRAKFLKDPAVMWWAKLPALVSKSVNELTYRQFNYGKLMCMKSQLARWLHKRLAHNYTHADLLHPYHILFSSMQRDSGLLRYARTQDNVRSLETALEELVKSKVLLSWEKEVRRVALNKIKDIKYTLTPHMEFVSEIKAANARSRDGRTAIEKG